MKNIRFQAFITNPKTILTIILAVFFLKGVFLATLSPIFDGQDEARHYNTIQNLAEPKNTFKTTERLIIKNKENFLDYNFSEEIKNTGTAAGVDSLRSGIYNTAEFSNSYSGANEAEINSRIWKPYNYNLPADVAYGGIQLYHHLASVIEKNLANQSILVRFYLIRIFSVLLGTLAVFFFYLTAKTAGFSAKHSLLLTAVLSFQPKFSMYFANINYDVLVIPMFFLFTFVGTNAFRKGLDWKNFSLMILAIAVAILTKSTGFIMAVVLAFLLAYLLYEKIKMKSRNFRYSAYVLCIVAFIFLAFFLKNYLPVGNHSFNKIITSIGDYISKSLTLGRFGLSSRTYWGTLDWTNNWFMGNVINFIWLVQAFAVAGLGLLFFSKKPYPEYLPAKKYVIFFIGMIVALQLGIRTADWAFFNRYGNLVTGTPGRYFLPNLGAHILLLFTGLGALFSYFKKEKYFDHSLIAGLILMFALMMYLIFDVIIYRFYL